MQRLAPRPICVLVILGSASFPPCSPRRVAGRWGTRALPPVLRALLWAGFGPLGLALRMTPGQAEPPDEVAV